jgi:hypothetical protein
MGLILIDGDRLTSLMAAHYAGVSTTGLDEVRRLDAVYVMKFNFRMFRPAAAYRHRSGIQPRNMNKPVWRTIMTIRT